MMLRCEKKLFSVLRAISQWIVEEVDDIEMTGDGEGTKIGK
jgi:hypothetical protein